MKENNNNQPNTKVIVIQVKSQFDFYLFISGSCWFVVRTKAKYLYDRELVIEFKAICVYSEIFYSFRANI